MRGRTFAPCGKVLEGRTLDAMLTLARFSLGRVLLHLLAMMGDGAFRFHAAGILRELVSR